MCVAIFPGQGHRNSFVHYLNPDLFSCPESGREDVVVIATGGMDNAVKVWSTRGKKVSKAIEGWRRVGRMRLGVSRAIRVPEFSTFHAPNHFVDCEVLWGCYIFEIGGE